MQQGALDSEKYDRGVIVAERFDFEMIDKAYVGFFELLRRDWSVSIGKQNVAEAEHEIHYN